MARQRSCRCLHLQGHCRNSAHQLTEISLSAKPHNRTSYRRIGIDVRFAAFYRHRHDGRKGEAKRSHTITKMFLQGKFLYFREFFDLEAQEIRSEEHTSELQSLMRISYAVFCLKKKK